MELQPGAIVKVRAFGGQELVRRLVGLNGQTALICSDQEYEAAQRENREPVCVGFPLSDILESKSAKSET